MKMFKFIAAMLIAVAATGCTRIETGTVGLRVDASKQVQGAELLPGSGFHQTIVGDVIEFPVRDIAGSLENKQPTTKENVAVADMDVFYSYSLNPSAVSEIWTQRSRSLHHTNDKGDTFLMSHYVQTVVNAAMYKAVSEYGVMQVGQADNRVAIENKIKQYAAEALKTDKLESSIQLTLVQVRGIVPPRQILDSAAEVVRSANQLQTKQNEVEIAKKEAERMAALSANSGQSIQYMDAQARLNISQAILQGKVNTIVVPADFKGIVNVK